MNLSTHDETGLLIEGFQRRPTLLSPHNPPYYHDLVERCGYAACRDYYAYVTDAFREGSPALRRLERTAARLASGSGCVRIRAMDPARWDEEIATLYALYNESFPGVWGFVPMSFEEFSQRADSFRPFFRHELVILAEVDGAAVGFGLVLPDINEVLAAMRGRLLPLGWLRLIGRVPRIRTGCLILLGVYPAHTGRASRR